MGVDGQAQDEEKGDASKQEVQGPTGSGRKMARRWTSRKGYAKFAVGSDQAWDDNGRKKYQERLDAIHD